MTEYIKELGIYLSEGFLKVHKQLMKKLGASAAILFSEMLQRVEATGKTSFHFPSREIERITGINKQTQQRVRKILKEAGLIKSEKVGRMVLFTIDDECYRELGIYLSEGFCKIDKQLIKKLGISTAILFSEMLQRVEAADTTSFHFRYREIERITGINKKTQQRVRKILKEAGLIKSEKVGRMVLFTIDDECYSNYRALILKN